MMCFRDTWEAENESNVCGLMCLYYYQETLPCVCFFFSADCYLTQGVDTISMNVHLALKSCSLARALILQMLFLVLKEYSIVAACKPTFADFTQVHVQETMIKL